MDSAAETVTEPLFRRLGHRLRAWLWLTRAVTVTEHDLAVENQLLKSNLLGLQKKYDKLDHDTSIERIDWELSEKKLKAEAESLSNEVELLAGIIERDRMRVEAETAAYANQVAHSTAPPRT